MHAWFFVPTETAITRRFVVVLTAVAALVVMAVSVQRFAPVAAAQEVFCSGLLVTVLGSEDDDLILAGPGPDVIAGLGGDDEILGRGGDDTICGGPGSDTLYGQLGADELHGGPGPDRLLGGGGADAIFGEDGADRLSGGPDDDDLRAGPGHDKLEGGAGNDLLRGGPDDDLVMSIIGVGSDMLLGEAGSDVLIAPDGSGDDRLTDKSPGTNSCTGDARDRISSGCENLLSPRAVEMLLQLAAMYQEQSDSGPELTKTDWSVIGDAYPNFGLDAVERAVD